MSGRTVVIAGASGLVGTAAIEAFAADGWDVVAMSRRRPEPTVPVTFRHLSVDLTDREQTRKSLLEVPQVSHLVYAAAYEQPGLVAGWTDQQQMSVNRSMLDNVLAALICAGDLEHVTLMQGTKAYGVHLHPIPLPARERHPRDNHPNFYWLQEDLLREKADAHGFGWTIFRPVQVVGPAYGVSYCTPPVIGVFAAICHETGTPFRFPGGAISPARQVADARLVGNAIRWAAMEPAASGEHFNLTNGEVFSWQGLWPTLGEVLGVDVADPAPLPLSEFLPEHADTWDRIVRRHNLRPLGILDVLGQSHHYADYTFGVAVTEPPPPALVSTVKVKQAGFTEVRDTEDTFRYALDRLVAMRVLPRLADRTGSGT